MHTPQVLDVIIVGGGRGCHDILLLFEEYEPKNVKLNILGVADINPDAPGLRYAKQKGIFVIDDFRKLFQRFPKIDLVIELTGRDEVLEEIYRTKHKNTRVIDHVGARLFWEIIVLFREKSFYERKLAHVESLNVTMELVCHLAHELRNPLTILGGLIRRMSKYPDLPKELDKHIRIICDQVDRLEQVMEELTKVTQPLKIEFISTDINRLVLDTCQSFRTQLPRYISFEYRLDQDIPEMYVDPSLLREALWQLLRNAYEAVAENEDGKILVETRLCYDSLAIVIIDNGIGMGKEVLEKATLPFFTTKPNASGLGLYLVQKITTAHGGKLFIHSDPGHGTVVAIELPLRFVELIVPPV